MNGYEWVIVSLEKYRTIKRNCQVSFFILKDLWFRKPIHFYLLLSDLPINHNQKVVSILAIFRILKRNYMTCIINQTKSNQIKFKNIKKNIRMYQQNVAFKLCRLTKKYLKMMQTCLVGLWLGHLDCSRKEFDRKRNVFARINDIFKL